MLKFTVLFMVIILTDNLVSHVNTMPQTLDIKNLLQSLQKQMREDQQSQQRGSRLDDEENENIETFGSLKKDNLDSIVPLESRDYRSSSNRDGGRNAMRVERLAREVLDQVLQERNRQRADSLSKKRSDISKLLYYNRDDNFNNNYDDNQDSEPTESGDNKEDVNIGSLSDYSKVYVVLNSDTIKDSKNLNLLNDLLSSLLSSSQSKGSKRQSRHKGFLLNEGIRRASRDSSEGKFAAEEEKPRPNRGQSYGGYGGGGHGGRGGHGGGTAIPYLKQRGDIYEKDY